MKRQNSQAIPAFVEFWLVDGKPAGPGVSFAFDSEVTPPVRPSRTPVRVSVLLRRRRLSQTQKRMS